MGGSAENNTNLGRPEGRWRQPIGGQWTTFAPRLRRCGILPVLVLVAALGALGQVRRVQAPGESGAGAPRPDYDNFDVRDLPADSSGRPSSRALTASSHPGESLAGPRPVYSLTGPLTGPQLGDPADRARKFLEARGDPPVRAAASSGGALQLVLASRSRSPRLGLTHLTFRTVHEGVPVFNREARIHVDDLGRIWRYSQPRTLPPFPQTVEPKLSPRQAVERALDTLLPAKDVATEARQEESGPERRTVVAFQTAALRSEAPVSLTWFVLSDKAIPAWQMYLELGSGRALWVIIDGLGGRLLYSRNLVRHERPAGLVFRAPDRATPLEGPQSRENWTGWPVSRGPCASDVYPPRFRSGSQNGRCWVAGQQTDGNNAEACLDLDGDNLCDARALGSNTDFDFPFADAFDQTNDPAPDRDAALANAFYWVNVLHDWLYRLGFDEPAGNFQVDNYDRGGASGDAVRIDLHDPVAVNNATFITPPDGLAPRMELGLFSGLRRDTAFDGDILTHEYIHGLTTRLIGGPDSTNGLALWQSGAMAEGWSDAYAVSLTGDPVIGEYTTRNPSTGLRTVAYDDSPLTFGMFGTLRAKVIPNSGGMLLQLPQVHRDGEIWATVLWDLRQALGRDAFEQAVTAALQLTPGRPSMLDARDAILQAAQLLPGGVNSCRVWSVFAERGFGFSAALNAVQSGQPPDTALSVFESFDVSAPCGGSPPQLGPVLSEENGEWPTSDWTASGQWHRSTRRSASGEFAWWYGQESSGNYDTGGRNRGSLTSPPIDLSGSTGAVLEWDQFLRTEGFNNPLELDGAFGPYLNADSGRVMVSADGGSSWRVLTHIAHPTPGDGFVRFRINLRRFVDQQIRVRFDFDTYDSLDNQHEGWFLDNIRVSRRGPGPLRLSADPDSLDFSAGAGGSAASRAVQLLTAGGAGDEQVRWTATVSAGSGWLTVLPASGQTPAEVQVSTTPLGLAPGVYEGEIRFFELNTGEEATTVPVTLNVEGPPAPLAAWSFEEQDGGPGIPVTDATGQGFDGVTRGRGTAPAAGVKGTGRLLDGVSGHIEFPAPADFTGSQLTLRAWVKITDYPDLLGIVAAALDPATLQGWFVGVLGTGNVAVMVLGPQGDLAWLVSPSPLARGAWHAITATFDHEQGEAALYLDGERSAADRFQAHSTEVSPSLDVGKASWWDGYYLHLVVDEMILDDTVWDRDRVSADYAEFSPPPPDEPPAPVASWQFDNPAVPVFVDGSGSGHDAVVHGDDVQPVDGISGGAVSFSASGGYAAVDPHPDFASSSFHFSAWIKLDAFPQAWGVLFSNFDGDYRGWFLGISEEGRVITSVWGQPSFATWVPSKNRLVVGQWHHVALNLDELPGRAELSIDGEPDRSFDVSGYTPQSRNALTFGRASWVDGYPLAFTLDDATVFDAALPQWRIQREFERLKSRRAGPVAVRN